ncbi:MAG: ribosomal protein S18-alanine N-acetyltransferase [Actinobacteria bacterium]|nr:ribosomal protein S18-alanine N-acetyltransferase [Actinomycetota bacterium]
MITYRDANSFDIPVLVSLDKELFPYSPWSAGQYREEISAPTRLFVLALDDASSVIGYAGVFAPGGAEADVLTVGVVPQHRGQGIARELMAGITKWAIAQGSIAMMLEVKTDNVEAISLYESLGYSKLNVRKDYFGSGLDALVMRKELP